MAVLDLLLPTRTLPPHSGGLGLNMKIRFLGPVLILTVAITGLALASCKHTEQNQAPPTTGQTK